MSDTPTPETDEARMKGYGEFGGDWSPLERNCYEKHPEGDVVFCEVAEKLERERDEARRELAETISCIEQAVDFHQVHHQSFQASAIRNLLENINRRRKNDPR